MDAVLTLDELTKGNWAVVRSLRTTGTMRRRLQELGLVEGTKVECLQKSPFGDPAAYYIRGAVIAIRSEDAQGIVVSLKENK